MNDIKKKRKFNNFLIWFCKKSTHSKK